MNGYEKRTQQKKALILAAAQELFFHNGVIKTSVSEIAQKAGVSKVTIFHYFDNKENLLREVMEIFMGEYLKIGEQILNAEEPFDVKLKRLFSMGNDKFTALGTDTFNSEVWKEPAMQKIYREATTKTIPFIIRFFDEGKKAGVIDATIPNEALMAFVMAFETIANPGNHSTDRDYIIGVYKLFYYGLLGDKSEIDNQIGAFT